MLNNLGIIGSCGVLATIQRKIFVVRSSSWSLLPFPYFTRACSGTARRRIIHKRNRNILASSSYSTAAAYCCCCLAVLFPLSSSGFRYHHLLSTLSSLPNQRSGRQQDYFLKTFTSSMSCSKTHVTERDGSGTITISPKNESEQSGLVVICHGLGDTAEGFADVAEQFASAQPWLKVVLPTAPTQKVTMNMGMPMPSWYDIVGLDERSNENCAGIEESRERIKSILQNEHDATGLPYSRMMLAGFSQGGALSLFTGLQLEESLAGILVLSGYLPAASQLKLRQPNTPVWHGHGTMDPLVQYAMAEKTKSMLTETGVKKYDLKSYPIQHTVSPSELGDAMAFLKQVLPFDESVKITLKDPSTMSVKELKGAIRKAGLSDKAVGLMEKSEFIRLLQDHRNGKL